MLKDIHFYGVASCQRHISIFEMIKDVKTGIFRVLVNFWSALNQNNEFREKLISFKCS